MGLIARPYLLPTDLSDAGAGGNLRHNIAVGVPGIASFATTFAGSDNDVKFTAVTVGSFGDGISVQYKTDKDGDGYPLHNQPLSITVVGKAITFHLATDEYGVITTVANDILAAVADYETNPALAALVTAALTEDYGTGLVLEVGPTFLSGGTTLVAAMTTADRIVLVLDLAGTPADHTGSVTEIVNGGFVLAPEVNPDEEPLLVVWLKS